MLPYRTWQGGATDLFGYIKPVNAELRVKEYELYRAVYCGLCAALGRNTSCASRLSLSYDFVFLAIVRMALAGESGRIERRRCITHPTKKRAVLVDAPQLDYCARLSSVLTYYKLCDDISDSRGFKRLGAYVLKPAASHMRRRAKLDPEAENCIKAQLDELSRLEADRCESIDRAAEPFGELMAYVTSYGFESQSGSYRIAREIGRHIGRFIYIADALDDLEDDIRGGSYNPFKVMYDDPKVGVRTDRERIFASLTHELMGIEAAMELIDYSVVPEYGEIARNIIYLGLTELRDRLLNKYAEKAENGDKNNDRPI